MADAQMKILHVTTQWAAGGSERNIAHHLACLRDAGHDVHLAVGTPYFKDRPPVPGRIQVHQIPTLLRNIKPGYDLRTVLHLSQLMRRERFDVIHTHLSKAGICGRIAAFGTSSIVIHTVHGPQTLGKWYFRLLDRMAAFQTDTTVFVGDELRQSYMALVGIPKEKSTVIHSPVGAACFLPLRKEPYPTIQDKLRVAVATRLVEGKGLEKLSRVVLNFPSVELKVAGEGPLLPYLREEAERRGISQHLRFIGYLPDIAELLRESHLLLHLSALEGLPQIVVQALAAGRPVVASGSLGTGELIRHGYNGLILNDGSTEEIIEVLRGLHEDPELLLDLAAGARAFDVQPWDDDYIAGQQLSLLGRFRTVQDSMSFGPAR
jgi:glycosyltransferase involved in cell wall biosynthesis